MATLEAVLQGETHTAETDVDGFIVAIWRDGTGYAIDLKYPYMTPRPPFTSGLVETLDDVPLWLAHHGIDASAQEWREGSSW